MLQDALTVHLGTLCVITPYCICMAVVGFYKFCGEPCEPLAVMQPLVASPWHGISAIASAKLVATPSALGVLFEIGPAAGVGLLVHVRQRRCNK